MSEDSDGGLRLTVPPFCIHLKQSRANHPPYLDKLLGTFNMVSQRDPRRKGPWTTWKALSLGSEAEGGLAHRAREGGHGPAPPCALHLECTHPETRLHDHSHLNLSYAA